MASALMALACASYLLFNRDLFRTPQMLNGNSSSSSSSSAGKPGAVSGAGSKTKPGPVAEAMLGAGAGGRGLAPAGPPPSPLLTTAPAVVEAPAVVVVGHPPGAREAGQGSQAGNGPAAHTAVLLPRESSAGTADFSSSTYNTTSSAYNATTVSGAHAFEQPNQQPKGSAQGHASKQLSPDPRLALDIPELKGASRPSSPGAGIATALTVPLPTSPVPEPRIRLIFDGLCVFVPDLQHQHHHQHKLHAAKAKGPWGLLRSLCSKGRGKHAGLPGRETPGGAAGKEAEELEEGLEEGRLLAQPKPLADLAGAVCRGAPGGPAGAGAGGAVALLRAPEGMRPILDNVSGG